MDAPRSPRRSVPFLIGLVAILAALPLGYFLFLHQPPAPPPPPPPPPALPPGQDGFTTVFDWDAATRPPLYPAVLNGWTAFERPLEKALYSNLTFLTDAAQPGTGSAGAVRTTFLTSLLGGALLGQEKYSAAEPLLLKGYEGIDQFESTLGPLPGNWRLAEAIELLVWFYEATNQQEKAREWREKLAIPPSER